MVPRSEVLVDKPSPSARLTPSGTGIVAITCIHVVDPDPGSAPVSILVKAVARQLKRDIQHLFLRVGSSVVDGKVTGL